MVYAIMAIGFLGFMVWGHHMFMSGMSPYSAFAFSLMTMAIGVPSAIKTFNWLGTIHSGRVRFHTPMLFAIGFVSLFVSGGLSGPFLAQPVLDIPLHDTYFVVGHFHLIMGVAAIFGMFAATYYWFPKMFGRMMNERLGKIHFWITLVGTYAIFMPMHYLGMAGHPRRYSQLTELAYLHHLIPLQTFMTYAAFVTIAAQLIFVFNLFWSMFKGPKASDNPWECHDAGVETATPPPHDNFGGHTPVVNHGPYEYSVPGAPRDYVMQTDPAERRTDELRASARDKKQGMSTLSSLTITDPSRPAKGGRGAGTSAASLVAAVMVAVALAANYGERLRRARLGLLVGSRRSSCCSFLSPARTSCARDFLHSTRPPGIMFGTGCRSACRGHCCW